MFFIVWAVLLESGESAGFIPAGIVAGVLMITAVVIREYLVRRARLSTLEDAHDNELHFKPLKRKRYSPKKLSIGRNEKMIAGIYEQSKAAYALGEVSVAHWEAFESCDRYLRLTRQEIARTHINSPRLKPMTKSRGKIKKLHKRHLLKWAKSISSEHMIRSKEEGLTSESRIKYARMAQRDISTALEFYPREKNLIDSAEAVNEYIETINIAHMVEEAEAVSMTGDDALAMVIFQKALIELDNAGFPNRDKEMIAEKIRAEIAKLDIEPEIAE